jgi:uncharacterized protein YecT (DUF1311 family)
MHRTLGWLVVALLLLSPPLAAQTQLDLNARAGAEFAAADAELNGVYQQIRKRYRDEPQFLTKLRDAQRAWIAFRDAELEAIYPPPASGSMQQAYGSMLPMCLAEQKARLTRERTAQLRRWLEGGAEGDACAGSAR